MKKFLLASVCLLALTACSQGQQGKGTTAASSKQEATQNKKEQVQTKTFVSDLGDHHQKKKKRTFEPKLSPQNLTITIKTKFKSATKKMKLSLLLFLVLNPFPQICKTWIFPS